MPRRRQARGHITEHSDSFTLNLHKALLWQLPRSLEKLVPAPLDQRNLQLLGDEKGVYQLFEGPRSVYVGKSESPLAVRLDQHRRRCTGRLNIDVVDMRFRCLYVDEFVDAAAPERVLIRDFQTAGLAPWNVAEGFAPRDVGRHRDGGRPGQWFLDRPVDHQALVLPAVAGRPVSMEVALRDLKSAVPFDVFRFASARSRAPEDRVSAADYIGCDVTFASQPVSVLEHLYIVIDALSEGWQATVLPQGVIIYKENRDYPYALSGWRKTAHGVERVPRGRALASPSLDHSEEA